MEALVAMGVVAATPLVLQFILIASLTPEQREAMDGRIKIWASVALGGVLALLISLYTEAWFLLSGINQFWTVLNGCIDGALSTGAVSIGFKVVKNLRGRQAAPIVVNNDANQKTMDAPYRETIGTVEFAPSGMIE